MDYNYSFQDNIPSSSFNSTSQNVLNWIEENREKFDWAKDPNAYEMTNLFLFGAKYLHEGKDINVDSLTKMWNTRSRDFERCNISTNNFVYAICSDAYQSVLSGKPLLNDENSHHALRKMAGLGLYLKQMQRDNGTVQYNNPQELLQFLHCSNSLKTFHPDLFRKYAFDKNINVLCGLQLDNKLPDELVNEIKVAQEKVLNESKEIDSKINDTKSEIEL